MTDFGPYILTERLATGGMGEVYRAVLKREGGFERQVVIKRILPHLCRDTAFVAMFENEARLTARLSHPNIIQIYDFGRIGGQPYLAMEYVSGCDLRSLLRDEGAPEDAPGRPLETALAVEVAIACCDALAHAYRAPDEAGRPLQVIHRDISPHNVLLSVNGEIKLTDFGLARALPRESITGSGALKGKLAYMAPEQAEGRGVDARTDVFGVGALLYECLTGRTLYDLRAPLVEVLGRILAGELVPLSELRPDLPPALLSLVERALAVDPRERFDESGAMGEALRAVARRLPAASAPLAALVQARVGAVAGGVALEETVAGREPPRDALRAEAPADESDEEQTLTRRHPWAAAWVVGGLALATGVVLALTLPRGGEQPSEEVGTTIAGPSHDAVASPPPGPIGAPRSPIAVEEGRAGRRALDEAPAASAGVEEPAAPVAAEPLPRVKVGGRTHRVPAGSADVRRLQFGPVHATLRLVPGADGLEMAVDAKPYCEVRVDGGSRGTTPVSVRLSRGRGYRVALFRGGFEIGATSVRLD